MQQTGQDITAALLRMRDEDRAASPKANAEDLAEQLAWRRVAAAHGDRLREILRAHGWPTDPEAAEAAWLLAQHADRQLDVQRLALRLLQEAVRAGAAGEDGARQAAFLDDRLAVNEGREQSYGTQIGGITDEGAPVPWPVADPEGMDTRRAAVGIPPFEAYTRAHAPQP
ncbi:hypothetical protein GCM10009801_23850 [Streptomyces albiaxialis]|uniref:Uncharacterized protein n=1 Tax=Streptomyces albiaxialis TaxID=329523 RepID=A0ABN2VT68_9ACTN